MGSIRTDSDLIKMFTRMFGKSKQETNALTTMDKLNEVSFVYHLITFYSMFINLCISAFAGIDAVFFFIFFYFIGNIDMVAD